MVPTSLDNRGSTVLYFVDNYLFFQFFHMSSKNEEDQLTMNETSFSFIFLLFFCTMIVFFCVGEEGSFWI